MDNQLNTKNPFKSISSIFKSNQELKPENTIIYGHSGSGKTSAYIIPTLLKSNDNQSFVVFDVKGELYRATSKYRATLGKVMCFYPESNYENNSINKHRLVKWNPLSIDNSKPIFDKGGKIIGINLADLYCKYNLIFNNLFKKYNNHRKYNNYNLITNVALALLIRDGNVSLNQIYNIFDLSENEFKKFIKNFKEIVNERKLINDTINMIIKYLDYSINNNSEDSQRIIESVKENVKNTLTLYTNESKIIDNIINNILNEKKLNFSLFNSVSLDIKNELKSFIDKNIANATRDSDFSFKDLRGELGKPVTLYIIVSREYVKKLEPIFNIFYEELIEYNSNNEKDWSEDKKPALINIMENFELLGEIHNLPPLTRHLYQRKSGFFNYITSQHRSLISNVYGDDINTYLNGTGLLFFIEYYSKIINLNYDDFTYRSRDKLITVSGKKKNDKSNSYYLNKRLVERSGQLITENIN